MKKTDHHPAAFINSIAEEGTKSEAVHYLQETWDELINLQIGLITHFNMTLAQIEKLKTGDYS